MIKTYFTKSRCPFAYELDEECYCVKMDSLKVDRALYYCLTHFRECEIYKRKIDLKKETHLQELHFCYCGKE